MYHYSEPMHGKSQLNKDEDREEKLGKELRPSIASIVHWRKVSREKLM